MPTTQVPPGVDPNAYSLWAAIKQKETGNKYNVPGQSGEYGVGQWQAGHFEAGAMQYLGSSIPVHQATPAQQDFVGYSQVKAQLDAGHSPAQIASWWNSGNYDAYKDQNFKGVNKYGASYNVPQYVNDVGTYYGQYLQKYGAPASTGGPSTPPPTAPVIPTANADTTQPPPTQPQSTPAQQPTQTQPQPTGISGMVGSTVQSVVDDLANPFLRLVSNVRAAGEEMNVPFNRPDITNAIQQRAATQGYNYGYFGNAKTVGADSSKNFFQNLADTLGVGLNIASYVVPIGATEKGAQIGAEEAGKGILGKVAKGAMGALKGSMSTPSIWAFSGMQGASKGLEDIGQGKGAGQSVLDGVSTTVGTAASIGLLNATGWVLGTFGRTFMQTKAADIMGQRINDILGGLKSAITSFQQSKMSETLRTGVNAASDKLGKTVQDMLGYTTSTMLHPWPEKGKGMQDLLGSIWDNTKSMFGTKSQKFSSVFSKGFSITRDDALGFLSDVADIKRQFADSSIKDTQDLIDQVTQIRNSGKPQHQIQQELADLYNEFGKSRVGGSSLVPSLQNYLATIEQKVVRPLLAGKSVDISNLQDFIHFISPDRGTPTEVALQKRLQDGLYNTFEDAMKQRNPELATQWADAREYARQVSNTLDARFRTVFDGVNSVQQLAQKFIDGDLLPTETDTKEFMDLLGRGVPQFQQYVVRALFENAQKAYGSALKRGTPESLMQAGKAAAKVFDDFVAKVQKGSGPDVSLLTAPQMDFLHDASNMVRTDMWQFSKNAQSILGEEAGNLQQLYEGYKSGMKIVDEQPSVLADKIANMKSVEDIHNIKQFYTPEQWQVVTGNVLKNIASKVKSIFAGPFDEKTAQKFINSLGTLGGPNREEIFNELFGDDPALKGGIEELMTSIQGINTQKGITGTGIKAFAHGIAALIFAIAHHPIMATGSARHAIASFGDKSSQQIEDDIIAQYEKQGKIALPGYLKFLRNVGDTLKNRWLQVGAGVAGGGAVHQLVGGNQ